jgi:hypothetical protein
MTDPLSIAASVAGLVSLSETVIKLGYSVYSDVKGFPAEYQSLLAEISGLHGILCTLKVVLSCPDRTSSISFRE